VGKLYCACGYKGPIEEHDCSSNSSACSGADARTADKAQLDRERLAECFDWVNHSRDAKCGELLKDTYGRGWVDAHDRFLQYLEELDPGGASG
jgi:hypothetical protein